MEGLPTFFSSPIFTRVLVPGIYSVLILNPFIYVSLPNFLLPAKIGSLLTVIVVLVYGIILGIIIASLDKSIYYIFEGYHLWPSWLLQFFIKRHNSRIKRLLRKADECDKKGQHTQCDLIWEKLLTYPEDRKGDPVAHCPTLLGNLLAAYEEYPNTRYGMDAVFYWPRLWLLLNKETKREITDKWSRADCWVYLSSVTFIAIWLYLGAFALSWTGVFRLSDFLTPLLNTSMLVFQLIVMAVLIGLFIYLYQIAIIYHIENGDAFRSIFDIYGPELLSKIRITEAYRNKSNMIWSYLQYLRIQCSKCGNYYPLHFEKCDDCGTSTKKNLASGGK
ncbi:hypothetical protein KAX97_02960 [candidate division WOR-3 bacterium]|nr:hypothetical protein [candidate division WOR-3 bacterium]